MAEGEIGTVLTYFSHVGVAAIKLTGKLKIGDRIRVKGATTDFEQTVDSMQVDRKEIEEADAGDEVGIKSKDKVRPNDKVFLVE